MKRRPKVFISANSSEFREWRRIATEELLRKECDPISMDHFPTGAGNLVEMLEGMIRSCDAMICLIGQMYGEPVPGHPEGRSYTQLEYDLAVRYGINQFLLFSADSVTPPQSGNDLQIAFRVEIKKSGKLRHTFSNEDEFRRQILGMRIETRDHSTKGGNTAIPKRKSWLPMVLLFCFCCSGLLVGWLHFEGRKLGATGGGNEKNEIRRERPNENQEKTGAAVDAQTEITIEEKGPPMLVNMRNPSPGMCGSIVLGSKLKEFAWCPPGKFLVGFGESEPGATSSDRKESPPREIKLNQGFWISTRELSVNEARSYVSLGFEFSPELQLESMSGDLPVSGVSWADATHLCEWLQSRVESGWIVRLPYEAEWEYACRSGEFGQPFGFGSVLDGTQANCDGRQYAFDGKKRTAQMGTTVGGPVKVDSYLPNAWNIYNMHGNVREWCKDYFAPIFDARNVPMELPTGPKSGAERVLRGGFWASRARSCRAASRESAKPDISVDGAGIRLLLQKE